MFAPFAATRTRLFRVAGKDAGNSGVTYRRCLRGEGEGEGGSGKGSGGLERCGYGIMDKRCG